MFHIIPNDFLWFSYDFLWFAIFSNIFYRPRVRAAWRQPNQQSIVLWFTEDCNQRQPCQWRIQKLILVGVRRMVNKMVQMGQVYIKLAQNYQQTGTPSGSSFPNLPPFQQKTRYAWHSTNCHPTKWKKTFATSYARYMRAKGTHPDMSSSTAAVTVGAYA